MKNKKTIVFIIVVFIVGVSVGFVANLKSNTKTQKVVSGYSFEVSNDTVINKKLNDRYLDSFVTVVNEQDKFTINLEGINEESNVFIINPNDGNMTNMEYNNGKFFTEVDLNKDINYGIIVDYTLVGSIRVVENIKNIDEDKLFTDILIGVGCGI